MIDGFIEPVGTSFQSATAERNEPHITRITAMGLTQSRQTRINHSLLTMVMPIPTALKKVLLFIVPFRSTTAQDNSCQNMSQPA
jgi:hypothetical protein